MLWFLLGTFWICFVKEGEVRNLLHTYYSILESFTIWTAYTKSSECATWQLHRGCQSFNIRLRFSWGKYLSDSCKYDIRLRRGSVVDLHRVACWWDRTQNKWERHSTATWLKGVTKVEQSTAILDIVQSGPGLTSFYGYYLSQNFQLLTMRRCIATGCKNDPKTWKLLPYLWNGHKFFKLGPLNWATCLLFLFWNCKIQVWVIKNKVLYLLPKLATPRHSV